MASKKAETQPSEPVWNKWQFWALTGGVVVAAVLGIFVIPKIAHDVNGGDVRPCNPSFHNRCFGEGH